MIHWFRLYDECCLHNYFQLSLCLTSVLFFVLLLFGYVLCGYILKKQQCYNTSAATTDEGRCVWFTKSSFTMSFAYVFFSVFYMLTFSFILVSFLLWYMLCEYLPKQQQHHNSEYRKLNHLSFCMLLRFRFQDMFLLF